MTAASKSALSKLKKDQMNSERLLSKHELSRLYAHVIGRKPVTYVGYTNNLKRITLHNMSKGAKFTRGRKWKLIYKEKYSSKKEAISRILYKE